jgi:hypothetical protein
MRTEGYQALRCPTCGEGVFVLPRSPLPEPASAPSGPVRNLNRPASSVTAGFPDVLDEGPVRLTDPIPYPVGETHVSRPDADADGEIEWVDEPDASVGPGGGGPITPSIPRPFLDPADLAADEIRSASGAGERTAEEVEGRPSGKAPEAKPPARPRPPPTKPGAPRLETSKVRRGRTVEAPNLEPVTVIDRPGLGDRLRRHRNLLIFVSVALLVAGTVAYRVRRARLQGLPLVAERGRAEGLSALDEGRFDTASQLLSEARRAVDELGDSFEGASAIRQGAREAEVIVRLAPGSLESMLDEAARSADARAWAETFDRLYKGRTVLIDAEVTAAPDGQGSGRFELDYKILPPGEGEAPRTIGLIDTAGFKLIEERSPRVGDHVVFGATLASFRYDLDREVWLVRFEPDSGVPITHYKALQALRPGWPSDADEAPKEERP